MKELKLVLLLSIYLIIFFLLNFYFDEIVKVFRRNNYYLLYTSLEFLIFTTIIYSYITSKKFKYLIIILSALFILFLIIYYSTATIKRIDSIPIGIESILLFIYIFYYFYSSMTKIDHSISLYERSSFWFIVGIFIYLGITFFFNILGNTMEDDLINSYYHFSYLGDILKNILFSIAVFLLPKNQESNSVRQTQSNKVPYLDMI